MGTWLDVAKSNLGRTVLSKAAAYTGKKLNLPEMKISEKLAPKVYADTSKSNDYSNAYSRPQSVSSGNSSSYSPSSSGGTSGSNYSSYTSSAKGNVDKRKGEAEDAANSSREANKRQIEAEYNNIMSELSRQETGYNEQLPLTEQQISQSYGEVIPSIQQEQAGRVQNLEGQISSANQENVGVMGQARQMYNELLSGLNQYSGSGAQAYGELLGRSTAQTMGDAKNNLTSLITNVRAEIGTVNTYYSDKLNTLEKNKGLAIEQARNDFRDAIREVNNKRNLAQEQKAAANINAMAAFKQQVYEIRSAADTAKNSLDQWRMEKESTLQDAQKQAIKEYKLSFTDVGNIAEGVAKNGVNNQGVKYSDLYGLVGTDSREVDWNKLFGNTTVGSEDEELTF